MPTAQQKLNSIRAIRTLLKEQEPSSLTWFRIADRALEILIADYEQRLVREADADKTNNRSKPTVD